MIYGLLIFWAFLTVVTVVGGVIGWYQLHSNHQRVSVYLARIVVAEAFRSLLTFVSLLIWAETFRSVPIYVALSTLSATLLSGAIWGWLLYCWGYWNGGGWRELLYHLKGGSSMINDKEKVEEDAPKPTNPTTPDIGEGTNAETGSSTTDSDTGGVTDGPGKTP